MGKSAYIVYRKRGKEITYENMQSDFLLQVSIKSECALRFPLFSRLLYIKAMGKGISFMGYPFFLYLHFNLKPI